MSAAFEARVQVPKKIPRFGDVSLANKERRNQFCVGINSDKHPLIADFGRIARANVGAFLLDEAPNLVDLYAFHAEVPHLGIHQALTALSSFYEQSHDRVPIQFRNPFGAPNRVSFQEKAESENGLFLGYVHRVERAAVRLRVRLKAFRAAEAA